MSVIGLFYRAHLEVIKARVRVEPDELELLCGGPRGAEALQNVLGNQWRVVGACVKTILDRPRVWAEVSVCARACVRACVFACVRQP